MSAAGAGWTVLLTLAGASVLAAVAFAVALAVRLTGAVLDDLVAEEFRTRLDRLPCTLLALAVRRLPADAELRVELAAEWTAELDAIAHETAGLPITRVCRGTRFAAGLLCRARRIGRTLAPHTAAAHGRKPRPGSRSWPKVAAYLVYLIRNATDIRIQAATAPLGGTVFGVAVVNAGASVTAAVIIALAFVTLGLVLSRVLFLGASRFLGRRQAGQERSTP